MKDHLIAALLLALALPIVPAVAEADVDVNKGDVDVENADRDSGEIKEAVRDAGQTVEDATITARIETMYLLNENLNPFRINTTTKDGVVTLDGTVDDAIEKDLAEALARNIDGVSSIDNQLNVDPKDSPRVSDERRAVRARINDANLTADVRQRLAYNKDLSGANIGVDVRDQSVRLYGTVPSEEMQERAIEVAEETRGILEVRNDLVVEERAEQQVADANVEDADIDADNDGEDLGEEIKRTLEDAGDQISDEWVEKRVETQLALNRNVSMLDLDIEVENGVAMISGRVISDQQKDLAESITRRTSGVQDVQNNIEVTEIRTE